MCISIDEYRSLSLAIRDQTILSSKPHFGNCCDLKGEYPLNNFDLGLPTNHSEISNCVYGFEDYSNWQINNILIDVGGVHQWHGSFHLMLDHHECFGVNVNLILTTNETRSLSHLGPEG